MGPSQQRIPELAGSKPSPVRSDSRRSTSSEVGDVGTSDRHAAAANAATAAEDTNGGLREVPVRNEEACDAMSAGQRWRLLLRRSLCACMGGEEEDNNDDAQDGPKANSGIHSSAHHKNDAPNDDDEESRLSQSRTVRQYNLTNAGNTAPGQAGRRRPKTQNPIAWCLCGMSVILRHITRCIYQIMCCGSARHPSASLTHHKNTNANTAVDGSGGGRSPWRSGGGIMSNPSSPPSTTDPNRFLSRFLNFTFRSSFLVVILLAAAGYYSLSCAVVGEYDPYPTVLNVVQESEKASA